MIGGSLVRGASSRVDVVGPALVAGPAIVLAFALGPFRVLGVALAIGAIATPIVVGAIRPAAGPALQWAPSLLAVAGLAGLAPVTPWLELVALLTGLGFLVGIGRASLGPEARGRVFGGVALPAGATAIAFATSLLFAPSRGAVGVAAALIVGVVVVLAYLLGEPERAAGAAALP